MEPPRILLDTIEDAELKNAVPPSSLLNFQIQKQLMSNWCWAAVTASINQFYLPASVLSQGDIVSTELDLPSCKRTPPLPYCNKQFDLSVALDHLKLLDQTIDNVIYPDKILEEIISQRPVPCQVNFEDIGGHVVVIYGYRLNDARDTRNPYLSVADPQYGDSRFIAYNDLINNYRGGIWVRTYLTQPAG